MNDHIDTDTDTDAERRNETAHGERAGADERLLDHHIEEVMTALTAVARLRSQRREDRS